MAKRTPSPSQSRQQFRRRALTAVVVTVAIALGAWWYLATQRPEPLVNTQVAGPVAVTPEKYTDFIGIVKTATTDQLTIETSITLPSGKLQTKTFQVMLDPNTVHESLTLIGSERRIETRTDVISLGDMVQAFYGENLATLEAFTATRLIKIIRS